MNPSNWKRRRDRAASPYPNAGDKPAAALADLIADFIIESTRWPSSRAIELRTSAATLTTVRDDVISGDMDAADATIWIEAGHRILHDTQRERSLRNHPAGKRRP